MLGKKKKKGIELFLIMKQHLQGVYTVTAVCEGRRFPMTCQSKGCSFIHIHNRLLINNDLL